jgi:predicted ArsR family transcriptional regulator
MNSRLHDGPPRTRHATQPRGARTTHPVHGQRRPADGRGRLRASKAAIVGDFYVLSVSEDQIVLGNRRCPFGDAVRRAPSLCQMTANVFGGLAERNTGHGQVRLEQRIAVGDPECRVAVSLRDAPAQSHSRR